MAGRLQQHAVSGQRYGKASSTGSYGRAAKVGLDRSTACLRVVVLRIDEEQAVAARACSLFAHAGLPLFDEMQIAVMPASELFGQSTSEAAIKTFQSHCGRLDAFHYTAILTTCRGASVSCRVMSSVNLKWALIYLEVRFQHKYASRMQACPIACGPKL